MTDIKPMLIKFPWFTLYGQPDKPGRLARLKCAAAMLVHEAVELVAGTSIAHSMNAAARYSIGAYTITVPPSQRNKLYLTTQADGYPTIGGELVGTDRAVELRVYASGTVGTANESIFNPGALVEVRLSNPQTGQWELVGGSSTAAGIPETEFTVFMHITGHTIVELASLFGWANVSSGLYWDSSNTLWDVDADAETITATDPQPVAGSTATILFTLAENFDFVQLGQAVYVQPGPIIDIAGPYLYQTTIPPDAVTSVDGRTGVVTLDDLYLTPDNMPYFPTGRVYDITDPQFGAIEGDDCTDAFDAACAAAALVPGDIFVPAPTVEGLTYIVRRPIVVPPRSRLVGQGAASVITRNATVVDDVVDWDSVYNNLLVTDATQFTVGTAVAVSDIGNYEWNTTHAVITAITDNYLTLDRPLISNYDLGGSAVVRTQFPLVTNNATPGNDAGPIIRSARVENLTLDHNAGVNDPTDSTLIDFTNSTIHWENGWECAVSNVRILNSIGDAYSDQARSNGYNEIGAPTANTFTNNYIDGGLRHGVHVGSSTSGAQVKDNHIIDCVGMAFFLCRHAQNTQITDNRVVNCGQGLGGSDARQGTDDDLVTGATALNNIKGDIGTICNDNVFIGGVNSDRDGALPAILLGPQSVAVGNNIIGWNGGIRTCADAVDCTITGNNIELAANYSSGAGISLMPGSHRAQIVANTVRGGGGSPTFLAKQDAGVSIDTSDYVNVGYNSIIDCTNAYLIAGDMTGLQMAHNTANMIGDPWGIIRIYGTLTDASLDVMGMDLTDSISVQIISYQDGAGEAAQVRLLVNNVGDNGSNDPSVAGDWFDIESERYNGVTILWTDGVVEHQSQWFTDRGWVDVSNVSLRNLASGVGVRAVVNSPTLVLGHDSLTDPVYTNLSTWPDGSANGFFTREGTTYMVAPGGDPGIGDGVILTEVIDNDITRNRGTRVSITDGPVGATWLGAGGGVYDSGTDLYLITHVEEQHNSFGWWYGGISKSTDNGATWVWQHSIFEPLLDKPSLAQDAQTGNGALIEHEGYLYVFHGNFLADGSYIKLAVVRASVASVEADLNEWATWTGTAWVEGGVPAELLPESIWYMQPSGFDVIEVGSEGHGLLFTDGTAGSYYLYSPDLLRWDLHDPQLVHSPNATEELYRTFWSGDPVHPKRLTDAGSLFVTQSDVGSFDRWTDNRLVRYDLRRFDLSQDLGRASQTAMTYIELSGELEGNIPGTIFASAPNQTFVMPPASTILTGRYRSARWTIVDSYGGATITTADGDSIPINGAGDVTLAAGDLATIIPLPVPMWVALVTPTVGGSSLDGLVTEQALTDAIDALTAADIGAATSDHTHTGVYATAAQGATADTAVQPAALTRLPLTTRSSTRYGANFATSDAAGSPLVPYETSTAPSPVAVAAGTLYYWSFSGLKSLASFSTFIFEVTATALTSGQSITIGMWSSASDGGPGTTLWTETVTLGTTTGIIYKTGLTRSRPSDGWIGFLNPSGNSGSVTLRQGTVANDRMMLLGSTVGQRGCRTITGQSAWTSDMSATPLNNTGSYGSSQTAPIILGGL